MPETPPRFRFLVLRLDIRDYRKPTLALVTSRSTRTDAEAVADACRADLDRVVTERDGVYGQSNPKRADETIADEAARLTEQAEKLSAIVRPRFDPNAPALRGSLPSETAMVSYLVVEDSEISPAGKGETIKSIKFPPAGTTLAISQIPIGRLYAPAWDKGSVRRRTVMGGLVVESNSTLKVGEFLLAGHHVGDASYVLID